MTSRVVGGAQKQKLSLLEVVEGNCFVTSLVVGGAQKLSLLAAGGGGGELFYDVTKQFSSTTSSSDSFCFCVSIYNIRSQAVAIFTTGCKLDTRVHRIPVP